jgi:hypothetical protein
MFILLGQNSAPLQFESFAAETPVPQPPGGGGGSGGNCCSDIPPQLPNLASPQAVAPNFPKIAMIEDLESDPTAKKNFPNITLTEEEGGDWPM